MYTQKPLSARKSRTSAPSELRRLWAKLQAHQEELLRLKPAVAAEWTAWQQSRAPVPQELRVGPWLAEDVFADGHRVLRSDGTEEGTFRYLGAVGAERLLLIVKAAASSPRAARTVEAWGITAERARHLRTVARAHAKVMETEERRWNRLPPVRRRNQLERSSQALAERICACQAVDAQDFAIKLMALEHLQDLRSSFTEGFAIAVKQARRLFYSPAKSAKAAA